MRPSYIPGVYSNHSIEDWLTKIPWGSFTEARQECFFAHSPMEYTYGSGRGVRTYQSLPYASEEGAMALAIEVDLNLARLEGDGPRQYNVCFLNRYDSRSHNLGFHADDSPGMDHDHPIAVVSFGQAREIWWKPQTDKGLIPPEQRQLLEHGSVLIMPPQMQRTHFHRIPKGDRDMGPRVSLTFRRYEAP